MQTPKSQAPTILDNNVVTPPLPQNQCCDVLAPKFPVSDVIAPRGLIVIVRRLIPEILPELCIICDTVKHVTWQVDRVSSADDFLI